MCLILCCSNADQILPAPHRRLSGPVVKSTLTIMQALKYVTREATKARVGGGDELEGRGKRPGSEHNYRINRK